MSSQQVLVTPDYLDGIGNAIRAKLSVSTKYKPAQMEAAIYSIPSGITPTGTINITQNGTVDVTQYASASVNVSGGDNWNEPIIRNWDFSNPVNTRGQSSYTNAASINGWYCVSGTTCEIVTGGIHVKGSGTNMFYAMNINSSDFVGKTFTLSLYVNDELGTTTFEFTSATGRKADVTAGGIELWMNLDSSTSLALGFYHSGAANTALIQGMKLEYGSIQTLVKGSTGSYTLIKNQNINEETMFLRKMASNF